MSSKIDAKIGIQKIASEEARLPERIPCWCQEGGKGGCKFPPWGRRFGRKEERKKRRKEERKEERKI